MLTLIDTQQHHQIMPLEIETNAIEKDIGDMDVRKTSQIDRAGSKIRDCQIDDLAEKIQNNNNLSSININNLGFS